jgi:cytoskeleton protein RodZ
MAKREPEVEQADEEFVEPEVPPAGERLRVAREEKGLSLEDVAAQTRIPQRHLASIETGDWDSLPAPTYTIGFAKSYAAAVDLDRTEIGIQLREEMGGQRFSSMSSDVFEPADPARTMPKSLVIGAIVAVVVLIALMSWLNHRSLDQGDQGTPAAANQSAAEPQATLTPPAPTPTGGSVVLTAIAPVWLQVSERGGPTLYSGMLNPGQAYTVPSNATAPVLKTGKPEALKITVGNSVVGQVGPPATTVTNVSLLPADLLKPQAATAQQPTPAASGPTSRPRRQQPPSAAPLPAVEEAAPATNNGQ